MLRTVSWPAQTMFYLYLAQFSTAPIHCATKSLFCSAVILAFACRIKGVCGATGDVSQLCLEGMKRMVGESLFQYSETPANIQAIILLVAYADSTWFAIDHGLQMALDPRLEQALSQLQFPGSALQPVPRHPQARVWIALCFKAREPTNWDDSLYGKGRPELR